MIFSSFAAALSGREKPPWQRASTRYATTGRGAGSREGSPASPAVPAAWPSPGASPGLSTQLRPASLAPPRPAGAHRNLTRCQTRLSALRGRLPPRPSRRSPRTHGGGCGEARGSRVPFPEALPWAAAAAATCAGRAGPGRAGGGPGAPGPSSACACGWAGRKSPQRPAAEAPLAGKFPPSTERGAGRERGRAVPFPLPAGGSGGAGRCRVAVTEAAEPGVPAGAGAARSMEKLNKLAVPAGEKLRKLQKMVHDIKKNESGIINKFKKLKKKPPPSLPRRDYASEHADNEEEQWSDDFDSDYENPDDHSDSEMYVVPSEENPDDSYEPPPSEQEKKKIPSAFPISRGEYADNRTSHQQLPPMNKPLPSTPSPASSRPNKPSKPSLLLPSPAAKPKLPPKPKECSDDEDNYIVPVDNDDDNYIEPTESSVSLPAKPPVNRFMKPTTKPVLPASAKPSITSDMQEVYEVPEEEEKPSPSPATRFTKPLPSTPAQNIEHSHVHSITRESPKLDTSRNVLPLPRNRLHLKADHEANNNDDNHSFSNTQESRFPTGAAPSPLPRVLKKTSNAVNPAKPCLPSRDTSTLNEEKPTAAERQRGSSHDIPLPPLPSGAQKSLLQKASILPKVPEAANRSLGTSSHGSISSISSTADQDAGVHSKAWFAATCDRKTAEDALYRSNKDGSFLVRKSSGQDSRQPYTLVVFYNRRVYNIPIRFIEATRQYALGREKNGEERFDSVAEIVENHQHASLVLIDSQNNTKDSTKLKYIVRVS